VFGHEYLLDGKVCADPVLCHSGPQVFHAVCLVHFAALKLNELQKCEQAIYRSMPTFSGL
jgi:hypothetical protein